MLLRQARRVIVMIVLAMIAVACQPSFWGGTTLEFEAAGGNDVHIVWNPAHDPEYPASGHFMDHYEISVNGTLIASLTWTVTSCLITGLGPDTSYDIEVVGVTTSGERSDNLPASIGILAGTYHTPAGGPPPGVVGCATQPDTDGDRLPDWIETNTGVFVDKTNSGTDPNNPDTDGDGIPDGDEVAGTADGVILSLLGANPLRSTIFLEIDWMDDTQQCGAHSHRPSSVAVDRVVQAFAAASVANPDGSTGIDLIVDYGQGGAFRGGNVVSDTIFPIGSINGGVNGSEYAAIKSSNFFAGREDYFHYAVHMHNYNTSSTSSGQAELPGDDLIVSLQCFDSVNNTSNTIMHEIGHNLNLRHGGNENLNRKPNYNSVMNYRYQFPGIDGAGCDAVGDQILDYSRGTRIDLDEAAVNESLGVCGSPAIDWNGNSVIDGGTYSMSLNLDAAIQLLQDYDDWAGADLTWVNDADGARVNPPELIDEQPVPAEFHP